MIGIFGRQPGYRDTVFAEARALMDDGLDLDFVLDLFPEDAEWLRTELESSATLVQAYAANPASYFFEASLKARFLAAAEHPRTPAPVPAPREGVIPFKTAVTTLSLATAAAAAGVVTLGFVTAGGSVPGDWNYSFKLAGERLQYALSPGSQRVNLQIHQAETRVYEIQQLAQSGDVSPSDIHRLQDEVQSIANLAQDKPLDDVQKARLQGVAQTSQVVLHDTQVKQPALDAPVVAAGEAIHAAVLMALSATPPATVTTTSTSTVTATVTPSTTPGTASPQPTASKTPSRTGTPAPTETPAETPTPVETTTTTATATVSPTETPSPTTTTTGEDQSTATPKP